MKILSLIGLFIVSPFLYAQPSIVKESLSFTSKILGTTVKYSIILPADYNSSLRKYPVLYLLHGFTDNETAWIQFGEANIIYDRELAAGNISPMIIVMPDAGESRYLNCFDAKVRYEDFIIQEFIPDIDKEYRTKSSKEFRALAGLSMGGHGSLFLAMKHPEMFAAAAALSTGLETDEELLAKDQPDWNRNFAVSYGPGKVGSERLNDFVRQKRVLDLVLTLPVEPLKTVRYYINCGDDDFMIKGNMQLHSSMIDRGISHEFRVYDGSHNWTYWRKYLPEALEFVSLSFHR